MTANKMSDPGKGRAGRRKVAAVLAGGLVLGVGTMATLASWNDSEFASATFTAGQFKLEGAVDSLGATFSDHSSVAGALAFSAPVTNLTPNDVVAAPFAVRLAAGTTNAAKIKVSGVTTTGVVSNLTYTVLKTATPGCNTATTGTAVVPAGTAVTAFTGAIDVDLAKGVDTATAGAPAYLCFKVTAGAGLTQSQTGTVTFQLQGVSQ